MNRSSSGPVMPDFEGCTYVIFGATGNLSREKLMPALYHLDLAGELCADTRIVASGRRDWSGEQLVQEVRGWIEKHSRGSLNEAVFRRFAAHLRYFRGDLDDEATWPRLKAWLADRADLPPNIAFYRCPPWRAKRRRVVPGSREATRDTRRAEGAKGDPKGASERGVQSYGRPVCSRNELAMLWRNAG